MGGRLAAIPAADVVGYSRFMAADDAGPRRRLKTVPEDLVEAAISEHRGICIARDLYNQGKKPAAVCRLPIARGPVAKAIGLKRAGTPRSRAGNIVGDDRTKTGYLPPTWVGSSPSYGA